MRFCRFDDDRVGIWSQEGVRDCTALIPRGNPSEHDEPVLAALACAKEDWLRLAPLAEGVLDFDTPIRRPGKIIGAPVNYADHVKEMKDVISASKGMESSIELAGLFLKASSSLARSSTPLTLRFQERRNDYEVEMVVIVGKPGANIASTDALEHVAAYAIGLDITLRGSEDRSFRKSIDGYTIVGDWVTSKDEIGDPGDVDLELNLNGEMRQRASTRDLIFDVARLIEFASSFYKLERGDLIFTGTPAGVGPLRPGDVIEARSPQLGDLTVQVAPASSIGSPRTD